MLRIQRLNMDNTWWISWQGTSLLFDPWLFGTEIDGGRWLNEQWHRTPPVPLSDLPPYDAIVVTQSYNDHCHLDTLRALREETPIFATPKPFRKIQKAFPARHTRLIADQTALERTRCQQLQLYTLVPNRRLDPIYYALAIAHGEEALLLAPHGFEFSETQLSFLKQFRIRLLGTTFSTVQLPGFMGGRVNPGLNNAKKLIQQLQPDYVVNTHDEQKHARGIVMRIAKTEYPNLSKIQLGGRIHFLNVNSYEALSLS